MRFLSFLLLCLFPHWLFAAPTAPTHTSVVLYPVQVDASESQLVSAYGSALQEGLGERLKVYYGPAVEQFLEKEYQKAECNAQSCAQSVAVEFNTTLVVDGSVQKVEGGYLLVVTVQDVLSGEMLASSSEPCERCTALAIPARLKQLGRKLGEKVIAARAPVAAPVPATGAAAAKPVPASGQSTGYTRLAAEGGCVLDNATSLVWEVREKGRTLRSRNYTYSWFNPDKASNGGDAGQQNGGNCHDKLNCDTAAYVAEVNAMQLCGFADWRLPSRNELLTLVDKRRRPSIDSVYFPDVQQVFYWTSTTDSANRALAAIVVFNQGESYSSSKAQAGHVRLVRGGK